MKPLNARALKCVLVLEAAELADMPDPNRSASRALLSIRVADGRMLVADINAKALRKCKSAIAEHGIDGVAVILQGKLVADKVTEAGLVATPKTPKPAAEPPKEAPSPEAIANSVAALREAAARRREMEEHHE